jgi:hypothetical protein
MSITAALLPFVTYLLTLPRINGGYTYSNHGGVKSKFVLVFNLLKDSDMKHMGEWSYSSSTLDGSGRSVSCPGLLTPRDRAHSTK